MQYVNLTGTSIKISRMSLGTMMFGDQTKEEDCLSIMDYAFEHGVNLFDTASSYANGEGERIIGKGLKGRREKIILATKIFNKSGDDQNDYGLNRRHLIKCTDACLKRLNTDYIDLMYIHNPDYETKTEETLETMSTLIRSGKILYFGVSNHAAWQIADIMGLCDKYGFIKPVISQNVYNLLLRDVENELLPCLKHYQIGMSVYNPIAAGLLSGKYKSKELQENTRFANKKLYYDRYWTDKYFDGLLKLTNIAEKKGLPLLNMALRWCSYRPGVTSVLSGVSRIEQLKQNVEIFSEAALDEETINECNKVWEEMENKTFQYNR